MLQLVLGQGRLHAGGLPAWQVQVLRLFGRTGCRLGCRLVQGRGNRDGLLLVSSWLLSHACTGFFFSMNDSAVLAPGSERVGFVL